MDAPTDAPTVADAATSASADPVDVAPSLADPPSGIVTSRKAEQARAYLRTFVEDKAQWKFAKLQQVWLLQNLWFVPLLPTTEFETRMLPYLASLPAGPARASTIAEAHRVIAAYRVTVANQKKAAKAAAKAAELAAKQTADESTASMDAAATPSATTTPSPPPPMKVMTTAEIVAAGKAAQLDRAAAALKAPEHDAGAIADPADVVEEANHDMYQRARQVLAVFDETVESEDEEDDDESTDKTLSKKEKSKKSKKSKKEKKDKKDKKDKKRKERDE
ncbi:hypothetical protein CAUPRSCDRAFT_11869 [Caulochytrium protostelioides]|nr:hypothetical protein CAUPRSCDRAFT_11869 [Caulochytrium protostelioides]